MQNPHMLKPQILAAAGIAEQFSAAKMAISQLSRSDKLKAGSLVLRQIK
jgi:hypothetical protein